MALHEIVYFYDRLFKHVRYCFLRDQLKHVLMIFVSQNPKLLPCAVTCCTSYEQIIHKQAFVYISTLYINCIYASNS